MSLTFEWFGLGEYMFLPSSVSTHARYIIPYVGKFRMDIVYSSHWREPLLDRVRLRP